MMSQTTPKNTTGIQHIDLEVGVGLRPFYYSEFLGEKAHTPWIEAISENYMGFLGKQGGRPITVLESLRRDYEISLHGVSMSLGSCDELDLKYLQQLKDLTQRIQPCWVSDHLCWTGFQRENIHDLLPLPYTQEALNHFADKLDQAQNILQRTLSIENVSSYVDFSSSEMSEWEFLVALTKKSGCNLLLDVNNVYVSSQNHNFDPWSFISQLPKSSIQEIHLAGHTTNGELIIDTHDQAINEAVWDLYKKTIQYFGPLPTLIERDDNFPTFHELMNEVQRARSIYDLALSESKVAAKDNVHVSL